MMIVSGKVTTDTTSPDWVRNGALIKLLVRYSSHDLNNEPFNERTVLEHLNTELVGYSDPHWISYETFRMQGIQMAGKLKFMLAVWPGFEL